MLRMNMSFKWELVTLEDNLLSWKDMFTLLMDTPLATMWDIWQARNLATFQGIQLAAEEVCINILTILKDFGCGSMNTDVRVIYPPLYDRPLVTGYFDGAEQKGVCGVGMVIKLKLNHCIILSMVMGL